MFNINLDKNKFAVLITDKLKGIVHNLHVLSVINILFEEMAIDLSNHKSIVIHNFGKFFIKKTKPRKHVNYTNKKIEIAKGHYLLKFKMFDAIRNIIVSNLKKD